MKPINSHIQFFSVMGAKTISKALRKLKSISSNLIVMTSRQLFLKKDIMNSTKITNQKSCLIILGAGSKPGGGRRNGKA